MYLPPKIALRFGIPLVFYGENPIEYGNEIGSGLVAASKDYSFYSMSNKSKIYIAGTSYDELIDCFKLSPNSLAPYLPATENEVKDKKLDVQYLGYYLPWHPQDLYYFAVENSNFKPSPERTSGTYSKYSSIDDKLDDFHYYCTYIKFGIGRATYDSSQEIRNGEITRDEGIALVNRYDGEYPKRFEREIFEYLSLSEREFPDIETFFEEPKMNSQYFQDLTDKFRSPHIWKLSNGRWELRKSLRLSEEV